MDFLADRWRGDLGEGHSAKLAGHSGLPVRLLPAAGRLEGARSSHAGRSRNLLAGRAYRVVMRVLAVMLALFALLLFREGLKHLAVI